MTNVYREEAQEWVLTEGFDRGYIEARHLFGIGLLEHTQAHRPAVPHARGAAAHSSPACQPGPCKPPKVAPVG